MGSEIESLVTGKTALKNSEKLLKPFRTGKSSAMRAQKKQTALIEKQQKQEAMRLAEADSEVKKRKAFATRGRSGRQSLIATSETGLSSNLGGV